ncbi:MAG: hypothetical protein AB7E85_08310 [Pseudobdellovibrionaceae bacterium]
MKSPLKLAPALLLAATPLGGCAITPPVRYADPVVQSNCDVTRTATQGRQSYDIVVDFDTPCAEALKFSALLSSERNNMGAMIAAAQMRIYREADPAFADAVMIELVKRIPDAETIIQIGENNLSALSANRQNEVQGYANDNIKGVFVYNGDTSTTTYVLPESGSETPQVSVPNPQ